MQKTSTTKKNTGEKNTHTHTHIEAKRAFDISKNALLKAIIINYNYDLKRK